MKAKVSSDEFKAVQKRVRVYAVSDRDDAGLAVRKEFPQVLYVVDPCTPGDTGAYPAATWRGLSGDLRTDEFAYPARHMVEDRWLWDCVQTKGLLGKCYPKSPHYVESYTPSFLGLVDNGLGWAQNPTWGGWGGRYRVAQPAGEPHRILTTPSDRDDRDDCGRVRLGGGSVARWREDFQNDFAGRMRWAVTPEKDRANHAPVVVLNGKKGTEVLRIAARSGDTVKLSAAGSFDPDGNKFGYDWWIYREAGMPGGARLNGRGESVELDLGPLPMDAKGTIHVIVRARDGGSPWMASYRRAVVSVQPMPEAKMFIDPGHPGHPDWESPHRELPDGEFPAPATAYDRKKLRLERFGRGVVAWRDSFDTVCVGWRYFSYDPTNQTFDVYCDGAKVNARPIGNVTQIRLPYKGKATYSVKAHLPTTRVIHGGTSWTVPDDAPIGYIRIPVTPPPGGETRSEKYHMTLNDCSMGDLDGDGVMDIVIKWAPSDGRDNSHPGHTGPTWFEGVKIATGESLWKINLGMNCRSGEHYNPFVVYDFDGDGCAEMIVRSSDGTVDGTGRVLGDPEKLWAEGHGAVKPTGRARTWPREVAQGVIFASPFLCFGDRPKNYLNSPMKDLILGLPPVYDETVVLPGSEIGECIALARRKGDTWYVAVESGWRESNLDIPLTFLPEGKWKMTGYTDKPGVSAGCDCAESDVTSKDRIKILVRHGGGYVATLKRPVK